ncbi:predicted protein [Naegleria gruberi]|uniref:Predicted protein n=1 Tax=Naegleria gruberi TaxID=5762 RepID=D2VSE1_NAEGR|nr:uncharacterized protein NAEGRDRAFT_71908 [Naegleria gruberi]EFC40403.1 predicted protein [Naegleria gruberi]|eukprot:XP_002673147.1 predicted protein [Naegleria gruberi strain NEG-M]
MIIPLLTRFEKYKSYSEESSVYLLRLFIYVVLSTLILPVLLLTSLDGVIRYFEQFSHSVSGSGDSNWQALFDYLFLPQSGAFFINYTIQYSLLGCFVDMIRLKDLIIYFYLRFKSVTEEEKENATKISEFDLPLEYGYMIAFFGIILTFSVFVPLILPIGFFYFIVKHLIDRYNISRLCSKNDKARYKLSPDITSYRERNKLIVQMTFFCIIFAQFYVMLFFAKSGDVTFIHLFLMCLLLILSIVYALYWNIHYKTKFNPLDSNNNQLIHSTFYSQDEELSIFNNQLQDKFSYAYFPPFALESIHGLKEQREQEINEMKLTI